MSKDFHIPGYTVVSKIAEGGMATVWKARQEKLDRVVAIKILTKELDAADEDYQRFIYEARAAASLIHPHIVQVIDAGERDGFMYYIMEYVPGPTAGDEVSDGEPMEESRVLQIAQEVAEALDYAWRDHHVVHCDIKPDNLLLHRNGRTKVADLGLAQVLGKEGVEVEDDMTLGTPNYFSPEQALVEEGLDCRADMYALGATLYHLATGRVPFGDLEPEQVAEEQVHGQLPHPLEVNPDLSWGFGCLVERLMAKSPEDRYPDWSAVMADITAVKNGKLTDKVPDGSVKCTIRHKPVPESLLHKAAGPRRSSTPVRRAGPRRRRGNTGRRGGAVVRSPAAAPAAARAGGPIQRKSSGAPGLTAEQAAELFARRKPTREMFSVWPLVIGLAIVVLFLYSMTLLNVF